MSGPAQVVRRPPVRMDFSPQNLADRLKLAMDVAGRARGNPISQSELGRSIGLHQASINNLVRGKSTALKAENAVRMADALGVRVAWLVSGEGTMLADSVLTRPIKATSLSLQDRREFPQATSPGSPQAGKPVARPAATNRKSVTRRVDQISKDLHHLASRLPMEQRARLFGAVRASIRCFKP